MNALDTAATFVAEHKQLIANLETACALVQEWKDINATTVAERDHLRHELESWKQRYEDEKARAKRSLLHAANLVARIDMINLVAESIRGAALEIAQKMAEEDLEGSMKPEDLESLRKIAGTLDVINEEQTDAR